jgi:hypothetical protein
LCLRLKIITGDHVLFSEKKLYHILFSEKGIKHIECATLAAVEWYFSTQDLSCLVGPVAREGHLGVLSVLEGHLRLGGPHAVGTVVLPGDIHLVSRVESGAELAAINVANPAVGHVARLEGDGGLHSVTVVQLVGHRKHRVSVGVVVLDTHSGVINLELSVASDSLLDEVIGGTDVPVVAVKLLVSRSRDGRQLVIGVTLSVELELVVVPLAIEVQTLGADGVISINSSGTVRSKVEGALGKELIGSAAEVTKGCAEAHNVVLKLEWGSPLDVKTINTIN